MNKLLEAIQLELDALIDHINRARRELGDLRKELPNASDALLGVTEATEKATHNILALVEGMMNEDEKHAKAMEAIVKYCESSTDPLVHDGVKLIAEGYMDRSMRLTEMMSELSFQDLTCQTINRIVNMVVELERRIIGLVDGLKNGKFETTDVSKAAEKAAEDRVMVGSMSGLSRLQETQGGGSGQGNVDDLLKNFGF